MIESSAEHTNPSFGLSRAAVEKFRSLMQEQCGIRLSPEDAWRQATKLVSLYRMFMGPLPEDFTVRASATLPAPTVDNGAMVE